MSNPSASEIPHQDSLFSPSRFVQDWLTLSFFPGVGCTIVNRFIQKFGSPQHVLSAPAENLLEIEGVGARLANMISEPDQRRTFQQRALKEIERAGENNCGIICPDDSAYPERLMRITDPPVSLYCKGNIECLAKPMVAIVGSRAATAYGKRVSFELARELARQGVCIVSGMAMGIDGEAHAGALAGGGTTIGVLGCGVDVVYPQQHAKLFKEVVANGMLLSEYALGIPPDGFRFPERNRIISGVSLGTIVVEASLRSGSLITARLALDQGREVFAVPGRIDSSKSHGTHRLLQQGAKLVTCVDDVLEEFDMAGLLRNSGSGGNGFEKPVELQGEENYLLSCLDVYPITIDELVRKSGYETAFVLQLLLQLELKGMVRQLPGQQYERQGQINVE